MRMQLRQRIPAVAALAALAFGAVHLGYEHMNGGVQSHHLLNRADLPAISNWLGLVVLPLLGWALGVRLRNHAAPARYTRSLRGLWLGFVGALLYGAALATSFEFGLSTATTVLFVGLFLVAIALPVYRAEYMLGFVVGMACTFGAVLPALVAVVLAGVSVVARVSFRAVARLFRRSTRPSGVV